MERRKHLAGGLMLVLCLAALVRWPATARPDSVTVNYEGNVNLELWTQDFGGISPHWYPEYHTSYSDTQANQAVSGHIDCDMVSWVYAWAEGQARLDTLPDGVRMDAYGRIVSPPPPPPDDEWHETWADCFAYASVTAQLKTPDWPTVTLRVTPEAAGNWPYNSYGSVLWIRDLNTGVDYVNDGQSTFNTLGPLEFALAPGHDLFVKVSAMPNYVGQNLGSYYDWNSNNRVTLQFVPEPTTTSQMAGWLLAGGLALLAKRVQARAQFSRATSPRDIGFVTGQ